MEIKTSQKFCIITPLTPKIDSRETIRLIKEIKNFSDKTIGLDLSFVEDCTIEFIEAIKNTKAGIRWKFLRLPNKIGITRFLRIGLKRSFTAANWQTASRN